MQFRILILADLSGRENHARREPLGGRAPVRVDCGSVDDLAARLGVTFRLSDDGSTDETHDVQIPDMEGFHPDQLARRHPLLARLLGLRRRLADPQTCSSAAAEAREILGNAPAEPAPAPVDRSDPGDAGDGEFDALLGQSVRARRGESTVSPAAAVVNRLIRDTIRPPVVNAPEEGGRSDLVSALDAHMSECMDRILHDPAFQDLEASWRGLDLIARSVDATEDLELRILDISKNELSTSFAVSGEEPSPLAGAEETVLGGWEGQAWTAVVGLFTLDAEEPRDWQVLAGMGEVARRRGFTFFCGLRVSREQLAEGHVARACVPWQQLRNSPAADHLVLAAPRLLLRLPYGAATEPTEVFAYEEMRGKVVHAHYLWGSPAVAWAILLGQSLENEGCLSEAQIARGIDDLPAHTIQVHGETTMTPCAEFWLSEAMQVGLIRGGLTPLVSVRGTASVRIACMQTLSCKGVHRVS